METNKAMVLNSCSAYEDSKGNTNNSSMGILEINGGVLGHKGQEPVM